MINAYVMKPTKRQSRQYSYKRNGGRTRTVRTYITFCRHKIQDIQEQRFRLKNYRKPDIIAAILKTAFPVFSVNSIFGSFFSHKKSPLMLKIVHV